MRTADLWVIPLGLLLGYWIISAILLQFRVGPDSGSYASGSAGDREATDASGRSEWSVILGVEPGADIQAVRDAYRRLVVQYHPDKVAALGSELQSLAAEKTRQINIAYREALRSLGQR